MASTAIQRGSTLAPSAPPDAALDLSGLALDELEQAVISLDERHHITYCNTAAERLYGFTAPAVVGRRISNVISRKDEPAPRNDRRTRDADEVVLASGRATHITESGRHIPVDVALIPSRGEDGSSGYVLIIRDDFDFQQLSASFDLQFKFEWLVAAMSARFGSLAEEEIDQEIELWLRRLVEALDVDRSSFAELTPTGAMLVTHSFAGGGIDPYPRAVADSHLPWLTRELTAGRTVVLTRIPEDLPEEALAERKYFAECGMRSGIGIPITIRHAVVGALTFGAFRRQRGWPAHVVSWLHLAGDVFANAIDRKQAKQRLAQKQQELAHFGRVAAMGELASVIAHELDQPLTAVVSNAQAIRCMLESEEPDVHEADAALNDVIDAAMRISEIVRRERRLLRKTERSIVSVDLNEITREIELFVRADVRRSGARLSLELLPGLPKIMADRVQVQQVILNLTHNALQAMMEQPREKRVLHIRTASTPSKEVVLSVKDAGPPIDDALFEQMFQPFFTTKTDGLGMGLSISKTIVESQPGRIWATRNTGSDGLTMHVAFPQARTLPC
jgi:PAS domain S-box-containing protein